MMPPCNAPVFKNLNNIVNGSAWTIMLSTKLSELILFQSFTSLVNAFNCINYNSSKAIKQPAYPETFFFLQTVNGIFKTVLQCSFLLLYLVGLLAVSQLALGITIVF
uniref:Uncharacterized protein n=1 Tax=Catharus ustulatus TaxID=91951 RepID=A0A8C3UY48_CATUS